MRLVPTVSLLLLGASLAIGAGSHASDDQAAPWLSSEALEFHSSHLDASLLVPPGVVIPREAERNVLPFLQQNRERFPGKTVLEIGTGSGIMGLYAARLGARKVVATDINPLALRTANRNAERLGLSSAFETRLVPQTDMSAYSVIGAEEAFDIIISNPPYSLDLDAETDSDITDTGDLGFSIIRGFSEHLAPGGVAILFYDSLFYHQVIVKFARYAGYEVRNYTPDSLIPPETETLFNSYLSRLLEREQMDPDALRFDRSQDGNFRLYTSSARPPLRYALTAWVRELVGMSLDAEQDPLLAEDSSQRHPGIMVIEARGKSAK